MALQGEIAQPRPLVGGDGRDDLGDVGLDDVQAHRPGDGHPVVAVADEVQVADTVGVDGWHGLAAANRRRDSLPAPSYAAGGGAKPAIEVA